MSRFKPMSHDSKSIKPEEKKLNDFIKGADTHSINVENKDLDVLTDLKSSSKQDKTFTVPISDYDLEILRILKEKEDRSQRKIASRLLSEALRKEIEKYQ